MAMEEFEKWQNVYCKENCVHLPSLGVCKGCCVPKKQEEGWQAALKWIQDQPHIIKANPDSLWRAIKEELGD